MVRQTYTLYCHEDTDGGIAAAIYGQHILRKYKSYGWEVEITSVAHGLPMDDWSCREISFPCAILDFSLHSQFLNERFFQKAQPWIRKLGAAERIPPCAWIDHHPTGSTFSVLTPENISEAIPQAVVKWDTKSISTPGLLRTHHKELGIPQDIIQTWEEYIDIAEIVDGALFATPDAAHDFSSPAVQMQTLFSTEHPLVDRGALFGRLVRDVMADPNPERLLERDPLYPAILEYECDRHIQRVQFYERYTTRVKNVAVSNFIHHNNFPGLSRFLPYVLFPDVEYAVQVLPKLKGMASISCGINPWKKTLHPNKHLGNFFAENFFGGGHSFVAGGKVAEEDSYMINNLVEFLCE